MSTLTSTPPSVGRGRLPAPRRSRRPALAALALLLVLVGALGSALVAYRSGSRTDVLVARHDIAVGQKITRADLRVARVAADPGNVVDAAYLGRFIGTVATARIPEGTLVNPRMFKVGDVIPDGAQLVGLVVDTSRRTTQRPEEGDVVRIYYVSQAAGGQPVGDLAPGDTVVSAARVMQVGKGSSSDGTSITVLAKDADAGLLAQLAASGSVAVSVLPGNTPPLVDTASR